MPTKLPLRAHHNPVAVRVAEDGLRLAEIPHSMRTLTLCLLAVEQNPAALRLTPEKWRGRLLALLAGPLSVEGRPEHSGAAGGDGPRFRECFTEVFRRSIGGGAKTTPSTQIEWHGECAGVHMRLRSTVRLINPLESFMTPANMRLRDSFVGRSGHFVDIEVLESSQILSVELLQAVHRLASREDPRWMRVRSPHPPTSVATKRKSAKSVLGKGG